MFNSLFYTIPAAMDAAILRQEVIAHNIANVETPGYKRKDVIFEEELRKVLYNDDLKLKISNQKHLNNFPDTVSPKIITQDNTSITNDKNNVDIDYEMTLLVQNTLRYQTLSRLLSMNIDRYNTALRSVV
jgi:flagellar basal-body rod protein FlgB